MKEPLKRKMFHAALDLERHRFCRCVMFGQLKSKHYLHLFSFPTFRQSSRSQTNIGCFAITNCPPTA